MCPSAGKTTWRDSFLIGGLTRQSLIRVTVDQAGHAQQVDRWNMGARICNVVVADDGTVWMLEDEDRGRLLELTPR